MAWNADHQAHRGYAELCLSKNDTERASLPDDADAEDYFKSVGYMRFPKIEGADLKSYEMMKERNQALMLNEMKEETERMADKSRYQRDKKSLAALISYLVESEGMTYQEVADLAGMPYNTVKGMAWRERNRQNIEGD